MSVVKCLLQPGKTVQITFMYLYVPSICVMNATTMRTQFQVDTF